MALCLPRPLSDSSLAVMRNDCVAHERRLNGPLSISAEDSDEDTDGIMSYTRPGLSILSSL